MKTEIITGPTAAVNVGAKSAYVDLAGKRPSIVNASGDESGKTFTVVGTDMAGNAQTEVITGPAANATVLGSKTFQTISSITPSADTTGYITMGFTGVGITTSGVTGSATLDSVTMVADQSAILIDLNSQMKSLRERYIQQFTEQAVNSLKSTGEYLTNFFEAINKDK